MPETVPHQRIIHINRDMPKDKEGDFILVKKKNLVAAYKILNAFATYLWLTLAGNKDGFDLAFSPAAIHERAGMPVSTCQDQVNKLIAKGYLVPKSEGSNVYDFYETPRIVEVSYKDPQEQDGNR